MIGRRDKGGRANTDGMNRGGMGGRGRIRG